jgi:hypothetical protein
MAASGLKREFTVNAPEPVNEDDFKDKPEIRGGNRPADYQPVAVQGEHSGVEYVFGGEDDDDPEAPE